MTGPQSPSEGGEQHKKDEKWYERTRYQILLFAGGIALFGLLLGLILDWYINPQTSTQKKDLVQALGLITAGVAGAVGIYFTWRGQRLAREAQEANQRNTLAQLKNAEEQLRLSRQSQEDNQRNTLEQLKQSRNELDITRQGQITERFTRAIDQLGKTDDEGNKLFEIRLGGIYALERIARESEEDHWPIMEVLTAYVRQHAPWPEEGQGDEADPTLQKKSVKDWGGDPETAETPTPDPDIQAIMTVIRRRTRAFGHGEPEPLNLDFTNLSGADLREANLSGAQLAGVNLSRANLSGANLSGAYLRESDLTWADLIGANLSEAVAPGVDLRALDLREANLSGANLAGTDLRGVDLSGGADLSGAQLAEANLSRANLKGANLSGDTTILLLANFSEAVLAGANLEGAYLVNANLSGADLSEANLKGADLSGADLTATQWEMTLVDENTLIPPNFTPPAHGVKFDAQVEED
jgi:uncharacterized protein YjbI with pentapeptide repeats